MNGISEENRKKISEGFEEVKKDITNNELSKAREMLESLLLIVKDIYIEDQESIYLTFNNTIEFVVYVNKIKPKKKVVWANNMVSKIYYWLAYVLVSQKEYEKAYIMLEKCLEYNPVDVAAIFEKSEIFKIQNNFEKMREETEKAYNYIFLPEDLSRYYRNIGYYYTEKELFEIANAFYSISMYYDKTDSAVNELKYIAHKTNAKPQITPFEQVKSIFTQNNAPFNVSKENINILYDLYKNDEIKNGELTKVLKNILFKLTNESEFENTELH